MHSEEDSASDSSLMKLFSFSDEENYSMVDCHQLKDFTYDEGNFMAIELATTSFTNDLVASY